MIDKIRDFDTKYSNTVFLIALFIIISFLVYIALNNRTKDKICKMPNDIVNTLNYSYKVKYTKEDKSIDLYINRYDSKYLIEKNEDNNKNTYYLNYTDFLEKKSSGVFGRMTNYYIIDGMDNKLLTLDYLNDLSLDSTIKTLNERNCYINIKNNLTMCINLDNSIELEKDDYKLLYTIIDKNNVNDFNVYIDLDYKDEVETVE